MSKHILLLFVFSFTQYLTVAFVYGGDDLVVVSLPADVKATLEKNASELNQISFVWKRTRNTPLDLKSLITKTKCFYDYDFLGPVNYVFMWQNCKMYFFYTYKGTLAGEYKNLPYAYEVKEKNLKLTESICEKSFDGELYYLGNGTKYIVDVSTPSLGIYTLDSLISRTFPDVFNQEYTVYIGYKFPVTVHGDFSFHTKGSP